MKKLGKDRLFLIIVSLYISGIISSFLLISPEKISIKESDITVLGILYTFTLNYWYILLLWLFGLSIIGCFFDLLIIYFRGFIYGNLIIHLMKISFKYLLIISLIELILFIPMFIILSYRSIMISFKGQRLDRFGMENYNKLLFITTIVIFIYSVLLEIVGVMYG